MILQGYAPFVMRSALECITYQNSLSILFWQELHGWVFLRKTARENTNSLVQKIFKNNHVSPKQNTGILEFVCTLQTNLVIPPTTPMSEWRPGCLRRFKHTSLLLLLILPIIIKIIFFSITAFWSLFAVLQNISQKILRIAMRLKRKTIMQRCRL